MSFKPIERLIQTSQVLEKTEVLKYVQGLLILWNNGRNMIEVKIDVLNFFAIGSLDFHFVEHIIRIDSFGFNSSSDSAFEDDLVFSHSSNI